MKLLKRKGLLILWICLSSLISRFFLSFSVFVAVSFHLSMRLVPTARVPSIYEGLHVDVKDIGGCYDKSIDAKILGRRAPIIVKRRMKQLFCRKRWEIVMKW